MAEVFRGVHAWILRRVYAADVDLLRAVDVNEVCNGEVMVVAKVEAPDIEDVGVQVTYGFYCSGFDATACIHSARRMTTHKLCVVRGLGVC